MKLKYEIDKFGDAEGVVCWAGVTCLNDSGCWAVSFTPPVCSACVHAWVGLDDWSSWEPLDMDTVATWSVCEFSSAECASVWCELRTATARDNLHNAL